MGLTKYKLGDLIELCDIRNVEKKYSIDDVRGISTGKQFITTKANMSGVNTASYKVVNSGEFAYVADTSRRGDKIAIAYNFENRGFLISSIYTVFRVREHNIISPYYLFMYFNRPEFDRYARFNSWGSARETFSWEDFCDIEINLPPLEIQQKYVDIYNAMLANQQRYERGLDDLKLTFELLIDEYKHKSKRKKMGEIFKEIDSRNKNAQITNVQGININKQFMPSVANINGVDISKYKIVSKGQFAFSGMQTGRDKCIRIAFLDKDEPIIISPAYTVLAIKDNDILAEYVMMWFLRKEIDRLGWFMSDGSIRTNLDMDRFYEMEIPVPDLHVQQAIVEIYNVYNNKRTISEKLKVQITNICPILIKGSIEVSKTK